MQIVTTYHHQQHTYLILVFILDYVLNEFVHVVTFPSHVD